MVVQVPVEDEAAVVAAVRRQLDVDAVLLEEISRLQSLALPELAVFGASRVDEDVGAGALLETAEDEDLSGVDLKSSHVEHRLGHPQVQKLPAVLAL